MSHETKADLEDAEIKNIAILSSEIINQIAAGEVIQSPASVIKELVENSLDAAAKKIEIEIKGAGLLLIRVSDDGIGMNKENLKMATLRHATSKIKAFSDLQKVMTMGFRGEALASIASISHMKIESAFNGEGFSLENETFEIVPSSRKYGTLVEVRSLFYNVPVRKKFQKSLGALTAEIIKVVHSLALARPFVSFTLIVSDKKIIDSQATNGDFKGALSYRIKDLLGNNFLKLLNFVDFFDFPLKIRGFIGSSCFFRPNKRAQFLYVNERSVFSPLVSEAIKEGYGTTIAENSYPAFVLHLTIDPNLIDVNIHPEKKQIRFCEESFIRERLHKIVEKTFEKEAKIVLNSPVFQKEAVFSNENSFSFESFHEVDLFSNSIKTFREITILDEYFIFVTFENKIMVMDLKAASSFLFFEKALAQNNDSFFRQAFSFPVVIDLLKEEVVLLEANVHNLSLLGIDIRIIGDKTIAIDAAAEFLISENMKEVILFLLDEIKLFGKTEKNFVFEKKLAQKICRLVKSRKKSYTMEEARAVAEKILQSKAAVDPLGDLIMIEIENSDLGKLFSSKGAMCLT